MTRSLVKKVRKDRDMIENICDKLTYSQKDGGNEAPDQLDAEAGRSVEAGQPVARGTHHGP